MQQQIINVYPVFKDSWTIHSAEIAEKHVDRSIFRYEQAYIPKEITAFFHVEDLKPGSSKKIDLLHSNKSYAAEISVDNTSRARLSWGKELSKVINDKMAYCSKYFIEEDCTTEKIDDRPFIMFLRLSDIKYKVEFLIK
jgi:hypothetical protein